MFGLLKSKEGRGLGRLLRASWGRNPALRLRGYIRLAQGRLERVNGVVEALFGTTRVRGGTGSAEVAAASAGRAPVRAQGGSGRGELRRRRVAVQGVEQEPGVYLGVEER